MLLLSFLAHFIRSSLFIGFILLLSLLFPYYSLVAHNISLVAPLLFYLSYLIITRSLTYRSLFFMFLFITRYSLVLTFSLAYCSLSYLFISFSYLYRYSFIAHFIRSSLLPSIYYVFST